MNAWLTRVLGGAACTIGVLAFGAGIAHADEQTDHGLLHAVVKVATTHHTAGHASSKHHASSSHDSHSSHRTPAVHVRATVHVRANVRVLQHPSVRVAARVGVGTTHHRSPAQAVRLRVSAKAPVHVRAAAKAKAQLAPGRVRVTVKATLRPTTVRSSLRVTLGHAPAGRRTRSAHQHPARPLVSAAEVARVRTSRTHLLAAASDTTVRVVNLPVGVCLRLNAGRCGSGGRGESAPTTVPGLLLVPVVATADATAVHLPVHACVLIDATGCGAPAGTTTGNAPTTGTAAVPTIGIDVTTTVRHALGAAACLDVNGVGCGEGTFGNPPADPRGPVVAPVRIRTGGAAGIRTAAFVRLGQTPVAAGFDLGRPAGPALGGVLAPTLAGPLGTMPMLARTGLSLAGMVLFGAGLLLMLMGFAVLALRRRH